MKVTAIIPAAGSGKRMNSKKQFIEIGGKSVLAITVGVFDDCQSIDEIFVAVGSEDQNTATEQLSAFKKVKRILVGGAERQDSVYNCVMEIAKESDDDIIVIHDAARPLVTKEIISKAVMDAKVNKAVIVGVPAKDTIKSVSADNSVMETLDRASLWQVQTPQAFKYDIIRQAYDRAFKIGYKATDDSKLVERLGFSVKIIMGSYENIKITTKEDLFMAEAILKGRSGT